MDSLTRDSRKGQERNLTGWFETDKQRGSVFNRPPLFLGSGVKILDTLARSVLFNGSTQR